MYIGDSFGDILCYIPKALAGAVHNADRGRVPVFIYAGAAPFSQEGEIKGSKNEYIMWYQGKFNGQIKSILLMTVN